MLKDSEKTALVTGAAGFVGSNLCKSLLEKGLTVYGVDNFITGRKENITPLLSHERFHFVKLDITKKGIIKRFSDLPIHHIYHLACPTGVPNIARLCEEMLSVSSDGTKNVLEIARLRDARLVFTSSCEVYGHPEVFPQGEGYTGNVDTLGPRSAYEEGKRFSESIIAMYVQKYSVDAKIVRIFNTYGPGMSSEDMRVVPSFVRSIAGSKELCLYGDGEQTRTHLYVDDLVRGLQLVIKNGNRGEVYNIGSDKQVTVHDLAKLMVRLAGRENGITFKPHFIADHQHRRPCVEKIKGLGWQQKVSLEEGLLRMFEAYRVGISECKPEQQPVLKKAFAQ